MWGCLPHPASLVHLFWFPFSFPTSQIKPETIIKPAQKVRQTQGWGHAHLKPEKSASVHSGHLCCDRGKTLQDRERAVISRLHIKHDPKPLHLDERRGHVNNITVEVNEEICIFLSGSVYLLWLYFFPVLQSSQKCYGPEMQELSHSTSTNLKEGAKISRWQVPWTTSNLNTGTADHVRKRWWCHNVTDQEIVPSCGPKSFYRGFLKPGWHSWHFGLDNPQ